MEEAEPIVIGEVIQQSDLETVNKHLLEKLDALIRAAKTGDDILALTEAVAKFNSSIRNNPIFTPEETEDERRKREKASVMADILGN